MLYHWHKSGFKPFSNFKANKTIPSRYHQDTCVILSQQLYPLQGGRQVMFAELYIIYYIYRTIVSNLAMDEYGPPAYTYIVICWSSELYHHKSTSNPHFDWLSTHRLVVTSAALVHKSPCTFQYQCRGAAHCRVWTSINNHLTLIL